MPAFLSNLGMEIFTEDENSYCNLIKYVIRNGKVICGYYGLPYINHHWGDVQLVTRSAPGKDDALKAIGLDTHCAGWYCWDVRIVSALKDKDNDDPLSKVLMVKGMDGSGIAAIHVVNADVLPSFAEEEIIKLQMIAFPQTISYYPDRESFEEAVAPSKDGNKYMIGENMAFPIGIFNDTDDMHIKTLTQIHGTVKEVLWGNVEFEETNAQTFVSCHVETQFGDIEIIHTPDAVDEAQRKHVRAGATVDCMCYLSGDAAIHEYEKGIVLNHENHLKLLSYTMAKGDPERLRSVLANDFVYHSEASGKHFDCIDEFIDCTKCIHEKGRGCHPHYATITESIEDGYPVGTRCLALSYGSDENYSSVVFIDMNEENKIQRIFLSSDPHYRFRIDTPLTECQVDESTDEN